MVSLDVNQSLSEFEDGDPEPSISEVRILLTQPTTTDSDDLSLFIDAAGGPAAGVVVGCMAGSARHETRDRARGVVDITAHYRTHACDSPAVFPKHFDAFRPSLDCHLRGSPSA